MIKVLKEGYSIPFEEYSSHNFANHINGILGGLQEDVAFREEVLALLRKLSIP